MMTEADEAYEAAERIIAKAIRSGLATLNFTGDAFTALEVIPPQISEAGSVVNIFLQQTKVSDITPIARMRAVKSLYLNSTHVSDITPIRHMTWMTTLDLSGTQVTDISTLEKMTAMTTLYISYTPINDISPISRMTEMKTLLVNNTQVSDIAPISRMTQMTYLHLGGTLVSDIKPIANMPNLRTLSLDRTNVLNLHPVTMAQKLADLPGNDGLTFKNTPACRADAEIDRISKIENHSDRARALFAYLEDWVPPVPADSENATKFTLPDDGPMRSVPSETLDSGDEDQEALREDLLRKVVRLLECLGQSNELAYLSGSASHYRKQIDRPLDQIKVELLFSAANTLRAIYEADERADEQGRINDMLPANVSAPLKDVVETHGLFFMGFEAGAKVQQKALSGLTGNRNRELVEAAKPIVSALEGQSEALETEDQEALNDDLVAATGEGPSAEIGEQRLTARIGNMLGAMGRRVYALGATGISLIAGHYFLQFVIANEAVILAWLKLAQGAASGWFQTVMQIIRAAV